MSNGTPRIAIVADGPRLILSSVLLYTSIRSMLPAAEVVFGIPEDAFHWPEVSLLESLPGSEIVTLPAPLLDDNRTEYRIMNKINLLANVGSCPVFLCDSDMLFVRKFPIDYFEPLELGVKVADASSWSGDWNYIYSKFGLSIPKRKVITTTTKEVISPYYNSGFIYALQPDVLARSWSYAVSKIIADHSVAGRFPYADQISLPVALQLVGCKITELDVSFNQSIHSLFGNYFVLHHHDHYHLLKRILPKLLNHWCATSGSFSLAYAQATSRYCREVRASC